MERERGDEAASPGALAVPVAPVGPRELLGLHQQVLEVGPGRVLSAAGLGGDAIWLEWRGVLYRVRYSEILRALVRQVDPPSADAFPAGVEEVPPPAPGAAARQREGCAAHLLAALSRASVPLSPEAAAEVVRGAPLVGP